MTEPVSRQVRALSFGSIADDYDRYRPGPPIEAAAWLLPPGARLVADLGAGTGGLSSALREASSGRGVAATATADTADTADTGPIRIVAVDADRRMLAVLGRRLPQVERAAGRAEAIPLSGGTADLVGVSSAWHWMEPATVLPEVARVLRPGGVLGVLWSGPDRSVPWVADILGGPTSPSCGPEARPSRVLALPGRLIRADGTDVASETVWSRPEQRTFRASVPYRVADLVGLAASFSRLITLPPPRRSEILAAVAERIAAQPGLRDQWTDLPLRCICWRVIRR